VDFPITELMHEDDRDSRLVPWPHPAGSVYPRPRQGDRLHIHRPDRVPVLDDRCVY
jgi:hypothetical protein